MESELDRKAFWALTKLFINCHLKENKDVKYESNSNVSHFASQNGAENVANAKKHGDRNTLEQKRKNKGKGKKV